MSEFASPPRNSGLSRFMLRLTAFAEAMEASPISDLKRDMMRLQRQVSELESRMVSKTSAGE
jgi:hypothetical protein